MNPLAMLSLLPGWWPQALGALVATVVVAAVAGERINGRRWD
jgi:hypothetical protein